MIAFVIILSLIVIALGYFLVKYYKETLKHKRHILDINAEALDFRDKYESTIANLQFKTLGEALRKSLNAIDKATRFYNNEDEANRELADCLNVLGFDATYHFELDNNKIADVLVDNYALIEGKLDPDNSEINRLIGQITDYVCYNAKVYIVVFGVLEPELVNKIKHQIISRYPSKVELIYLSNPNRTRYPKSFDKSDDEESGVVYDLSKYKKPQRY